MSEAEDFTLVTTPSRPRLFDDYEKVRDGHVADIATSLEKALRLQYPELALTVSNPYNVDLLRFAAAGQATADLDIKDEGIRRMIFAYGNGIYEARSFAKYFYKWGDEYFILYVVSMGYTTIQYILKEPAQGESTVSRNGKVEALLLMIAKWQVPAVDDKYVYIYDRWWSRSKALYYEIQKANWKDVILNEDMKKTLTDLMHSFFDSEDIYKDLGVPWKRGVIFHGPAGNGKTISIKALMHSLFVKYGDKIPSLYVKAAPGTYDIGSVFSQARAMAPCLLILEDIDTIVTENTRSYFFNEVDGLENNDGLFMVASTNHLDKLDPGLSTRPSRFDRKYLFPLPSKSERTMYCEYWREKLKGKPGITFPKKLSAPIAGITGGFSFAYLKEAFMATLLVIAGRRSSEDKGDDGDDEGGDLDDYELWREMKKQVKQLRDDMDSSESGDAMSARPGLASMSSMALDLPEVHRRLPSGGRPGAAGLQSQKQLTYGIDVCGGQQGPVRHGDVGSIALNVPLMTDDGRFLEREPVDPNVTIW